MLLGGCRKGLHQRDLLSFFPVGFASALLFFLLLPDTRGRRQRELTRARLLVSSRWDRGGGGGQFSRFLLAFPRLSSPLRKHKKSAAEKDERQWLV